MKAKSDFMKKAWTFLCVPNFTVQRLNFLGSWGCQIEIMHANFENANTTKAPLKSQWLGISQGLNYQRV